jgi:hypothetical protein
MPFGVIENESRIGIAHVVKCNISMQIGGPMNQL